MSSAEHRSVKTSCFRTQGSIDASRFLASILKEDFIITQINRLTEFHYNFYKLYLLYLAYTPVCVCLKRRLILFCKLVEMGMKLGSLGRCENASTC